MIIIDYHCRICKKPFQTHCDDFPERWIEKLTPMLTCNPCYDLHTRFMSARDRICRACATISRAMQLRLDGNEMSSLVDRCRIALEAATLTYAKCIAVYRRLPAAQWSEEFAQMLIDNARSDQPNPMEVLKNYGRQLRQQSVTTERND